MRRSVLLTRPSVRTLPYVWGADGIIGLPDSADPSNMAYQYPRMLKAQVKRLLRHMERAKVRFCFWEDVFADPSRTFCTLHDILDLDLEVGVNFGIANPATGGAETGYVRCWICFPGSNESLAFSAILVC